MPFRLIITLAVIAVCTGTGHGAIASESLVSIKTRPGIATRVLVTLPASAPRAVAILFAGGSGRLTLSDKSPPKSHNFLVRSRQLFAERGFLTITVDTPVDRGETGLVGWRHSKAHMRDIDAIMRWARTKTNAPIWLIGTSRGTLSAAHGGVRLKPAGIVLASAVTRMSRRRPATIFGASLDQIKIPVLIINHWDDKCRVSPPGDAKMLRGRLTASTQTEIMTFSGGNSISRNPCSGGTAHGFQGVEKEVIDAIAGWIFTRRD